jgi:hypothetical protein
LISPLFIHPASVPTGINVGFAVCLVCPHRVFLWMAYLVQGTSNLSAGVLACVVRTY